MEVWPGGARYRDGAEGITSLHALSFGAHYDPDNLRFGALIAVNEEVLAPRTGFDEHPHSHTEIVTWVVRGELTHRDSEGNVSRVRPGDVQHLRSAGGVRHEECNDTGEELVFVQMWLAPGEPGGTPAYTVVRGLADATPYAVPAAGALLHVRRLAPGDRTALPDAPYLYVHAVRGETEIDGERLTPGDAARVTDARALVARALTPAELLVWELTR
ncbi:pirin family protein [Streptomyces sp. J2-1]|uniref:pirin family protein n=1 Tax=Streptomyces corallincola TaxID=2851888 RepID=UPI001C392E94|nr:pirin family protein [Streptomyces corallincola]MBV2353789.1 pirin family protein [Streptomyces corallincola]